MSISEIIFDEISGRGGNIGVITLNRPKALNALTQIMLNTLNSQLVDWADASHIKAVIIRAAEGRAFSAGGDLREIYTRKQANDPDLKTFFRDEYRLNSRICNYPKPYIALLNGITMGGGAGISIHGSHRVATKNLIFAMPETGIGFYPDVGASYFLSRLPYKIGFYLGLTGVKISGDDCFNIGLIDCLVKEENFPEIIYQIADASFSERENTSIINDILNKFSLLSGESSLMQHREKISTYFSEPTVEKIIKALESDKTPWGTEVAEIIKTKSPTSLKITLHALQEAIDLEFDECMQMEYRITSQMVEQPDFFEGIRAIVIEKDQKPKWQPSTLKSVTHADIEKYFLPMEHELF